MTRFYHSGLSIAPLSSLITGRIDYSYTEFLARTVKNETIIAIFFRPPLSSSPLPATTFRMKIREHANDEIRRPFEPEFADVRSSGEHPFVPGC